MKHLYKLIYLTLTVLFFSSCSDEDKDLFQGFTQGAYVRFANEAPPATIVAENESSGFSLPIEDINENTQRYSLDIIGTLAGTQDTIENAITITSFPATLDVSVASLADLFQVPSSSLGGGDNFRFIATAIRNDGVVFNAQQPVFNAATDSTAAFVSGGNASFNLLNSAGYRNAMDFNFTFACPNFTRADALGNYTVTVDNFGVANETFEITAGTGDANSITITGLFTNPFNADVDPITGAVSIPVQPVESEFFGFANGNVNSEEPSFMFSCSGNLSFLLQYTVDAGSFGNSQIAGSKM